MIHVRLPVDITSNSWLTIVSKGFFFSRILHIDHTYKGFSPDGVLTDSFALSAKRANTADTKNYNEEEFIASLKAEIDQDSLNKGKITYDASAYNNVYKISVMNGETETGSTSK